MLIDKPLRVAFLFSIGLHSILLSPALNFVSHPLKDNTSIEVTYINIKEEKYLDTQPTPIKDKKVTLEKEKKQILKEGTQPKDIEQKKKEKDIPEKAYNKKSDLRKKISIAKNTIDLNSITLQNGSSDSLNYLRAVRNEINSYVHRNYDSPMGEGEVLLHFVLNSDGSVRSASIIRDNLGNNKKLAKLCLDSIYLSSPFKSFPKDLDLPQAAFNISISFKRR